MGKGSTRRLKDRAKDKSELFKLSGIDPLQEVDCYDNSLDSTMIKFLNSTCLTCKIEFRTAAGLKEHNHRRHSDAFSICERCAQVTENKYRHTMEIPQKFHHLFGGGSMHTGLNGSKVMPDYPESSMSVSGSADDRICNEPAPAPASAPSLVMPNSPESSMPVSAHGNIGNEPAPPALVPSMGTGLLMNVIPHHSLVGSCSTESISPRWMTPKLIPPASAVYPSQMMQQVPGSIPQMLGDMRPVAVMNMQGETGSSFSSSPVGASDSDSKLAVFEYSQEELPLRNLNEKMPL